MFVKAWSASKLIVQTRKQERYNNEENHTLCFNVPVMKPAQEKIEKIDRRLRIQPLRGGNLLYIT